MVDKASKDKTIQLCENLSKENKRFQTIWSPSNRNVVDEYYYFGYTLNKDK